jgi:signal peptidase I
VTGRMRPARHLGSALRGAANGVAIVLAVLVIAAVGAVGVGLAGGYRPVVITGGSMEPNVPDRSLVVARPVDQVAVGDVLVMRGTGRATVTHRIVELDSGLEGGPALAITRGDANPQSDPRPFPVGERTLVARWVVPALGGLVLSFATPLVGSALIVAVVTILVAAALRRIWRRDPGDPGPDLGGGDTSQPPRRRPSMRWCHRAHGEGPSAAHSAHRWAQSGPIRN